MSLSAVEEATEGPATGETKREPPVCRHCGAATKGEDFCCAGCAYVYRLIHAEGLEAYYRIKDDVTVPADGAIGVTRDFSWLRTLQIGAEAEAQAAGGRTPRLTLAVQGLSCAGCGWLIERLFQKEPGAGDIEIDATRGLMRLRWSVGVFDAVAWAETLQRFNYLLGPAGLVSQAASSQRELTRRIGLCGAFALNIMLFTLPSYFGMEATFEYAPLFGVLALAFATLSVLAGGGDFVGRAVRSLREGAMHIDLPIAMGIVGAYLGSLYGWLRGEAAYQYFDFVGTFILLMLVGRWVQIGAVERNQRRLLREQPITPPVRVRGADGVWRERAADQLRPGDPFEVGSGVSVPVEARLDSAEAALSLAWINGESEPKVFRAGQVIPAGAQNVGRRALRLVAAQGWDGSLLAELLQPMERADAGHGVIDRVVRGYVVGILFLATLTAVAWAWRTGDAQRTGAVVTAVLVVSCPCALGLAWPLADEIATVALRRRGVFLRRGDVWARLGRVRRLVFDKTGTLTMETPTLRDADSVLAALTADERAALAALVHQNPHPVARALQEALLARFAVVPLGGEIEETVGGGVALGPWRLGRESWAAAAIDASGAATRGDTVLTWGGQVVARFECGDEPRAGAAGELAWLARRGLPAFILSGDGQAKVSGLAATLGLAPERAVGGQSPRAKAAWLDRHGADQTMMLGDGANDSLAFDRALLRGTPVIHRGALEAKADFYYLGRGIGGLRALFEVADLRRRVLGALIVFSITYNVVAVAVAMAGAMSPLLAAVLMPASSLVTLGIVGFGLRRVGWSPG